MKLRSTFLLLAWALVASAAQAQPRPTILIGQSAGLTGGQAEYSADVKQGIEAYFDAVNKSGGVAGKQLKLVSEDDQGKKDMVLANTRKLVEATKVVALIGYTSGAGVEGALAYIDGAGVPMLSPATGNMGIRAEFRKGLFHTRAGYDEEMKKLIGNLAGIGIKRIAIAYLDDVGPANPKTMHDTLALHQLKAIAEVSMNRNATDFSAQVDTLMRANPEAVVFISNGPPIVKVIQGMRAKGYVGQFATSSFSGLKVEDLSQHAAGLVMSQVLPPPSRTHLKLVKEYQQHLQEFAPGAKPNYTSLESYISARVLVEGLRRTGGNVSGPRLVEALETLGRLDLGGYDITFSARDHNGSNYVDTGVVTREGGLRF